MTMETSDQKPKASLQQLDMSGQGYFFRLHRVDMKRLFEVQNSSSRIPDQKQAAILVLQPPPDTIYIRKFKQPDLPNKLFVAEQIPVETEGKQDDGQQYHTPVGSKKHTSAGAGVEEQSEDEESYVPTQSLNRSVLKSGQRKGRVSAIEKAIQESRSLLANAKNIYAEALPTEGPSQQNEANPESNRVVTGFFYKLGYTIDVVVSILEHNKLTRTENSHKAHLIWNPKMKGVEGFNKLQPHQKVNHFPNSAQLGRKDCLNKNIFRLNERFPKEFGFLPRSYLLPQEESLLLEVELCDVRTTPKGRPGVRCTFSSRKPVHRAKEYS